MTTTGRIAAIANRDDIDNQVLLARAAEAWRAETDAIVGVLAERGEGQADGEDGPCSADSMRDIASGRRFSIALETPPPGTSCHLDAAGITAACANLLPQIRACDGLILSKFGKLETTEEGLWKAFSLARTEGKPVLTTVSTKHIEAWTRFAPEAIWLEPDLDALARWWRSAKEA